MHPSPNRQFRLFLSPEERRLINALLDDPSVEAWEDARTIVLAHTPDAMTLEEAVLAVALLGWRDAPDAFTIRRALRLAARLATAA